MSPPPHVATLIDNLIAARKEIGGIPDWRPTDTDPSEFRLVMPLTIDGVSTGSHLEIISYPNATPVRFRTLLVAEKCVARIDYVFDEPHVNSFDRPHDLLEFDFCEPHYHSWSDNKRFCTRLSLPERLQNARILPTSARSFDSVLRWFCAELNIEQPPNGLIALPMRTTLIW